MKIVDRITTNLNVLQDKIFGSKFFTPKVKSALVILFVSLSSSFLLTAFAFFGMVFLIFGIGLLMLLGEVILILVLLVTLITQLFISKRKKDIEIGLLLGIFITIVVIIAFLNPDFL